MGNWAQGAGGAAPVNGGASGAAIGPAAAPTPSPHLIPNPAEYPCPRCTRQGHSHEKCKSFDKLCRKCNNIGHFTEVVYSKNTFILEATLLVPTKLGNILVIL